ncbi:hypothetical protein P5P86_16555 [Nocardioides sp. BP30]|uniref:hypothetical protein n=1 Tax=Nocardioides sp. BP30 TaxID=3036374 RepID=UPI002468B259|nr:hypothetical protein [Nocardioides sp. BP30]WGL51565.1 hypothetical protein P5P86_16555 [Nocardioides sp. BP30]
MSDFVYLALTLLSFAGLALLVGAIDSRLEPDPDPHSDSADTDPDGTDDPDDPDGTDGDPRRTPDVDGVTLTGTVRR